MRITGASLAAEVHFHRQTHEGAILLVEGDTDRRFFLDFVDKHCMILPAGGKKNAMFAFESVAADGVTGLLCVVDPDHDRLLGVSVEGPGVLAWAGNDLEVELVRSPALDRVLREAASPKKLQQLEGTVIGLILRMASPIGALRYLSAVRGLGLKFESIKYERVLDPRTCGVNVERLVQQVTSGLRDPTVHTGDLVAAIEQLLESDRDPWGFVCGHDLTEALSTALRRRVGTHNSGDLPAARIESELRMAFIDRDLVSTGMAHKIRQWESNNPGYRVLPSGFPIALE